jgi:putative hydrolase of the HAD superfamily
MVIPAEIQSPFSCQKLCYVHAVGQYFVCTMTRAVFLDALGTLVELEPPWISLRDRVPEEVNDERLMAALRAEMEYYREHAQEGRDEASLAELRERCAAIVSEKLGIEISVDELVEAIRFEVYPDVDPALAVLRQRGLTLITVSNWDYALPSVLERCGLDGKLDGTVTSAEVGARKPDPAIFVRALELARCEPAEALHVGDTPEEDVAGARAAGIRPLLIDRDGGGDISSLEEISEHL